MELLAMDTTAGPERLHERRCRVG